MVTKYRRNDYGLATVLTHRLINIGTDAATLIQPTSGAHVWFLANVGPSTLVLGDSAIGESSGGLVYPGATEWIRPIQGDAEVYYRADSVAGVLSLTEFA